jgi:hypothetical protein
MATNYKLQYSTSATPIEEVELAGYDAATAPNDIARMIHSNVEKSVGGTLEVSCGSGADNIGYTEYTTTAIPVDLDTITGKTLTGVDVLFVKIYGKTTDANQDCVISLDSDATYPIKLSGVGDSCLLRLDGLAGSAVINIKSSASSTCKVDIMWGIQS